jgi:hypothetical protein
MKSLINLIIITSLLVILVMFLNQIVDGVMSVFSEIEYFISTL